MQEDKEKAIYETPQKAKHTLYYKPGYNQYYFKREMGKIHSSLEGLFTSQREAEKAWKFYVKNHMKYNRTSKNIKELGEKEDKDFKLNKPTVLFNED